MKNSLAVVDEVNYTKILEELFNYIHLNASFCDDLGLCSGKSSAVLFFSLLEDFKGRHSLDISFNIFEELISQIGVHTPMTFGDGAAGIGSLVEILVSSGIIDDDPNEILAEIHGSILAIVYSARCTDISIKDGLSGFGIYLLSRYKSKFPPAEFERNRIQECVISIVDQIVDIYSSNSEQLKDEMSIYRGLPGALLFLESVYALNWYTPVVGKLIEEIRSDVLSSLLNSSHSWGQIEVWISVLIARSRKEPFTFQNEFGGLLDWCRSTNEPFDISENLHRMVWLTYLNEEMMNKDVNDLVERVVRSIIQFLSNGNIRNVYRYEVDQQSIPMGIARGATGCALALWALKSGTYRYLAMLGCSEHAKSEHRNV